MSESDIVRSHRYIKGDAMSPEDLARARADAAEAAFLLTNRFATHADEQDSVTVLRALNIKSFNPILKTYVQVLEPYWSHSDNCFHCKETLSLVKCFHCRIDRRSRTRNGRAVYVGLERATRH